MRTTTGPQPAKARKNGGLSDSCAEPEKEYRGARRAAVSQTNARFQGHTGAAATTVLKLMVDTNVPASVRLRASEFVVTHSAKAIELEDIEARVAELERAAEASKPGR